MTIKKKSKFKKLKTHKLNRRMTKSQPTRILKYGIINLKCCSNNTIITITLRNGKTRKILSCGSIGFKKAQRSKPIALLALVAATINYLEYFKMKRVICMITGHHNGLKKFLKGLKRKISILRVIRTFNLPHNGCRERKKTP